MLPLDGLGDYVDISLIVNPWQAAVAIVVVFAVLIWPQMSARQTVKRVEKTLTENNGGGSVKDALDRIEKEQVTQAAKLGEYIEWPEGHVKDTRDRLTKLESRRRFRWRR